MARDRFPTVRPESLETESLSAAADLCRGKLPSRIRELATPLMMDKCFVLSALDDPEASTESLFGVVLHRDVTEPQRLLAAIAILGKEDLGPMQALALVPVAPLSVRWESVLRAVRLGVSVPDLMEAARTVSAENGKDDLVHMICVASRNSTDALFDWAEDGAAVNDLVAVARSGLGRVSAEAAEIAMSSEAVTLLHMIDMLDEEFPQDIREAAALWLRHRNADHVGIIRYIQLKGL